MWFFTFHLNSVVKKKDQTKLRRSRRTRSIRYYISLYNYIKRLNSLGYIIHVHVSYKNIVLSLSKGNGHCLFCFTQGMVWDKNLKKGSPYAGNRVGYVFGKKVYSKCYFPLILKIYSKFNAVSEAAVAGLFTSGLYFAYCLLVPVIPHNGCSRKIIKRKKRRSRRRK